MSDKDHPDQPANPSRRRLFTFFTDRKAAGELGAELGRLYHDAQEAAHDLAQVGQEMAGALADAIAPSPPAAPEPAQLDPVQFALEDESESEAAADLVKRIEALAHAEAADAVQTRQVLEAVAQQLQQLNARIDGLQQSPDAQERAKAKRLDKVRDGLWAAVTGSLGYLVTRTGEAFYEGWVQENLLPLLPEWVRRPWEAFGKGEQPASPLAQPESPVTQPESPLIAPKPQALPISTGEPEIVYVPAGWFLMGSDKRKDPAAWDNELPQHCVWLDGYWIGKYPITNEQYAAFVHATEHSAPRYWQNGVIPAREELHPVVGVTWHDARAYCEWLGRQFRRSYRVPSEAEWEKAARGTDGRIWPWGNQPPNQNLCNFGYNVKDTTPVGFYPAGASPYGVLDMAGNVWEWTNTLWGEAWNDPQFVYPYKANDGREQTDAPDRVRRVLRGGSYVNFAGNVRCAFRNWFSPLNWGDSFGFRVVASPFTSGL